MTWFKRKTAGIKTNVKEQIDVPEGHWLKCPDCSKTINQRELVRNLRVCPSCGYHFRLSSEEYFRLLFDEEAFEIHDAGLVSVDPLEFVDRKTYKSRLESTRQQTTLSDAARTATGSIGGHPISVACMDFAFIGGSMGSVVGELVTRAIRRAVKDKTALNLTLFNELGLPFFVLLTNPTTGGVTASFAMLGDIHLAEPGALIGFAGPRVIRETMGQDLPDGFQRSEFLKERGFIDRIVDRRELKDELVRLLDLILEEKA
jgi:acetyl-CoA carboxylase carboxyl transferase subunit beta